MTIAHFIKMQTGNTVNIYTKFKKEKCLVQNGFSGKSQYSVTVPILALNTLGRIQDYAVLGKVTLKSNALQY